MTPKVGWRWPDGLDDEGNWKRLTILRCTLWGNAVTMVCLHCYYICSPLWGKNSTSYDSFGTWLAKRTVQWPPIICPSRLDTDDGGWVGALSETAPPWECNATFIYSRQHHIQHCLFQFQGTSVALAIDQTSLSRCSHGDTVLLSIVRRI